MGYGFNQWSPAQYAATPPGGAQVVLVGLPYVINAMPSSTPKPAPPGAVYPYIAAGDSTVKFDMRKNPRKANASEFKKHQCFSPFSQPTKHIQLICREFPWTVEIKDQAVTCGAVWESVYAALQEYITETEWRLANDEQRRKIERAVKRREADSGNKGLKPQRIDWLGETTIFAGLEKDATLAQRLRMPGSKENVETWAIRLAKRS